MRTSRRIALLAAGALVATTATATVAWAGNRPGPATQADGGVSALAAPTYQPQTELRFVPVAACKVADTRVTGKLSKKGSRTFAVAGTGLAGQGGPDAGCGVPATASSVAVTVVASGAKKPGYLRAASAGSAPAQVVVGYPRKTPATGSMTVSAAGIALLNKGGPTHAAVWVGGYYVKPLAAMVSDGGALYSGSTRAIGASRTATGVYEVQLDRNVRYCTATASTYYYAYYASVSTWFDSSRPDTVQVRLYDSTGNPVNQFFYLSLDC